jgi:hypothetical protein
LVPEESSIGMDEFCSMRCLEESRRAEVGRERARRETRLHDAEAWGMFLGGCTGVAVGLVIGSLVGLLWLGPVGSFVGILVGAALGAVVESRRSPPR